MKKIYAFDFDGTIVTNKFPDIGEPIKEVVELIKKVKSNGHYIILNTMREDKCLSDALEFCYSNGITFDAVNDNLPHMKEFYKNNPRKIFANYYIDDHNMFISEVNPPAYKFKDLKSNMWIWDDKEKEVIYLLKPLNWEPCKGLRYAPGKINHSAEGYYMDFEENRFFPVTKAMEYQEVKENEL